ncbi:iron-siderophore ABC transporter substrate-binding protein [Sphaerisporangium corydalis]|uniref:Iron-siderophore ABC transporter substrate-binding protein n=1 Tax=Sphaerisporangium corydalis TaxID=1441875 RepID=A0ABV9EM86_9ACTN|nr:iron-siderophore ABC transporter substrate-binding protein [Sphaerisporangium corydalis]
MFLSLRGARLAVALTSVLLLGGTVAACGSGSATGTDAATTAPSAAAPTKSAFPVTIPHKFGETTIKSEPKRIVTVGLTDQDAVLALGKVPVGTTDWVGGYKGAIGPWATPKLGGAAVPTMLTDTGTGPQVEKIAALAPDLILSLYGGITKEQYETLSKLAPVVAQPKEYNDYGIPWQQQTEVIGKALGKEDEAKKLVSGVEARFADLKKQHPEFGGVSAVVATPYEGFFVFGSQDPRSRTLAALGFSLPADLDKVIGDTYGANISKERSDLLDQGVTVWTVPDLDKGPAALHAEKVYKDLKVVKEGREVFIGESTDYGKAYSFVTVLSLPYTLDRLVPQLTAAVDGNPGTEVTQPAS